MASSSPLVLAPLSRISGVGTGAAGTMDAVRRHCRHQGGGGRRAWSGRRGTRCSGMSVASAGVAGARLRFASSSG
jgi:hypothetical protein